MTFQAEEKAITIAVVRALLSILPETWTSAQLKLERTLEEGGVIGCAHSISSPHGYKGFVEPSDELYEATGNLEELFDRHHRPWKRAKLLVELGSDGKWDYTIDYEYEYDGDLENAKK